MTRRRKLSLAVTSLGGVIALVGLAHVPSVRGAVLGGSAASCPFMRAPSAAELEGIRAKSVASLRNGKTAAAPARPAFGFRLDASTKEDVRAWAKTAGARCDDELDGAAIRCEGARADGIAVKDAFFRFDPEGRLVAVDVMREGRPPAEALALHAALVADATRVLGAPSAEHVATAADLGAPLARASAEYRFADYAADLGATNMGGEGVVVREQYRSLR